MKICIFAFVLLFALVAPSYAHKEVAIPEVSAVDLYRFDLWSAVNSIIRIVSDMIYEDVSLKETFQNILDETKPLWEEALDSALTKFQDTLDELKRNAVDLIQSGVKAIKDIVIYVKDTAAELVDKITELEQQLKDSVGKKREEIVESIDHIKEALKETEQIVDELTEVQLIQETAESIGLVNALTTVEAELKEELKAAVGHRKAKIEAALKSAQADLNEKSSELKELSAELLEFKIKNAAKYRVQLILDTVPRV